MDSLMELASLAGRTVVAAAATDAWEAARRGFARLLGRGDPDRPSWRSAGLRRHASSSQERRPRIWSRPVRRRRRSG